MTPTSLHCHILQAVKSMSETRRVGAETEEEEEEEGCYAECPWRKDQSAKICEWIRGFIALLVSLIMTKKQKKRIFFFSCF